MKCILPLIVVAAALTHGAELKWHPGHYVLTPLNDAREKKFAAFDDIAGLPALKGAEVRYKWSDLEPRKGVYDFSAIEADLERLSSYPTSKRLVIQIMDRRFNGGRGKNPGNTLPAYLLEEVEYHGGFAPTKSGIVARIWEQPVMDRLIALYTALGARFDREAGVEAIATEETAPALGPDDKPSGYGNRAMSEQFLRLAAAARGAFPHTIFFLYANWLGDAGRDLAPLIADAARHGSGIGGPDVAPLPIRQTDGIRVLRGEIGGIDYRDELPLGFAVQFPDLTGKYSVRQIYEHAYRYLHCTHIFWANNSRALTWAGAIRPFLKTNPPVHTAMPASYRDRQPGGAVGSHVGKQKSRMGEPNPAR